MERCRTVWFLSLFCVLLFPALLQGGPGQGERILRFKSRVEIEPSGWLRIKETIRVRSLQQKIRHGIYRDIPTTFFEVISVKRDGREENYHVVSSRRGVRVYMGKKGEFLPPGEHTYEFQYRLYPLVKFLEKRDRLFLSVTGKWAFPLEQVEVEIVLPKGLLAKEVEIEGQEQVEGSRMLFQRNRIVVKVSRSLPPGKGLKLSLTLPKGYLHPLSFWEKLGRTLRPFLSDCIDSFKRIWVLVLFIGFLGILSWYLWSWFKAWGDLKRGPVIPLFEPPEGVSAAAACFLWNKGWSDRCLTALLLGMAAKKKLSILEKEKSKKYQVILKDPSLDGLAEDERETWKEIWQGVRKEGDTPPSCEGKEEYILQVDGETFQPVLNRAKNRLFQILSSEYLGKCFSSRENPVISGVLLTFFVYIISMTSAFEEERAAFLPLSGYVLLLGLFFLWGFSREFLKYIKSLFHKQEDASPQGCGCEIFLSAILIMGIGFSMVGKEGFLGWVPSLFFAFLFVCLHFFMYNTRFPTKWGKEILTQLEGFRMYLRTAEVPTIETHLQKREPSLEIFQRYLPYAFALDALEEWVAKFSSEVEKSSTVEIASKSAPCFVDIPIPVDFLIRPGGISDFSSLCSNSSGDLFLRGGDGGSFVELFGGGFGGGFGGDGGGGW